MKNLLGNLKGLFTGRNANQHGLKINLIRSRITIRKALLECAQKGEVVGVYCPALNSGMLLVGIEDFSVDQREPVIIFKDFEMNGITLPRTRVALSEIRSICVFDVAFEGAVVKGSMV